MRLYGYGTKTFKDVFKDFNEFKQKYSGSPFFYEGEEYIGPSETTFKLIYNHYAISHIAFSEEDFMGFFENTLYEHFEKFEYDMKLKKDARKATDEEWADDGNVIQNVAVSPNTYGDTDSDIINSLDNQTKMNTRSGYTTILNRKILHNKSYYIKTFLNHFQWLFIKIIDKQYTPVWLSNDEGYLIEGADE